MAALRLSGLKGDTLAYGGAALLDRVLGFFILPMLAGALDKSVFGAWSQVLTAYALLSNVLLLGFYHSIMRYAGQPLETTRRVFQGMLLIVIANCLLFSVLASLAPTLFSEVLFASPGYASSVSSVSLYVVSEILFELIGLAFLRADRRIVVCSGYQALKSCARLLAIGMSLRHSADLETLLNALAAVNAALVIWVYSLHIAPKFGFVLGKPNWKFWGGLLTYSVSIVLTAMLGWANSLINRFVIVHELGLTDLGVFSANYSIASIASLVSLVTTFTILPHVNAAWNGGRSSEAKSVLEQGLTYYLATTLPLGAGLLVFYSDLSHLLLPDSYTAEPLLFVSLVGSMVLYGAEQMLTFATLVQGARFSVVVRGVAACLNLLFCIVTVHRIGVASAGWASMLSLLLVLFLSARRLRTFMNFRFPWPAVYGLITPVSGLVLVSMGIKTIAGDGIIVMLVAAGAAAVTFFCLEVLSKNSVFRPFAMQAFRALGWRSTDA